MSAPVSFGLFEFEPSSGELRREGTAVRIQPQPARVLALLIARAGETVTREELRQAVWPDGTHVDFERGLNFCIAQIRNALGDSADSPRFVETVPRRGYRFIAPVRLAAAVASPPTTPILDATTSAERRPIVTWRRAIGAALAVALVAAAAAVASRPAGTPGVRVAVLPFDNETGAAAYTDLAQAMADTTVARLATPDRIGQVAVIGNSAALRRPRSFRDLKTIGQEVNATFVVLAQVKRDESRVRLIAHLIRVSDEAHVWAQTFDRDAFTLEAQADIAETIAAAVVQKVAPAR